METPHPKPLSYYRQELRDILPAEALKPAMYKLVYMFIHVLFIFINIALVRFYDHPGVLMICSILMGLSIACLFLYSHELSHGAIIKNRKISYYFQLFFWAFSGFPPTVWQKVHNLSHHQHMNTYKDPDRRTFKSEGSALGNLYNLFIYPNKKIRFSITVGFAMIFYSIKHTLAVFYSESSKPAIVTYRPNYTKKEKRSVLLELLYIVMFWTSIWLYVGFPAALVISLISWVVYSTSVILFIITQHLRDPVFIKTADPFLTTTSVIIPTWLDRLIDWHSFHVEHHLFPGINFDYYPRLSESIQNRFPQTYDRISLFQAIKECYQKEILIEDPLI